MHNLLQFRFYIRHQLAEPLQSGNPLISVLGIATTDTDPVGGQDSGSTLVQISSGASAEYVSIEGLNGCKARRGTVVSVITYTGIRNECILIHVDATG